VAVFRTIRFSRQCGRLAWIAAAVLLLAALGGWWWLRPVAEPVMPAAAPAMPATVVAAAYVAAAPAVPPSSPAAVRAVPAPVAASKPPVQALPKLSSQGFADAIRQTQIALQGPASPKQLLQAAQTLGACKWADEVVKALYNARDQGDAGVKRVAQITGLSVESQIELFQGNQRLCQVFDQATLARQGELLKAAYDSGEKEAAGPYLLWLQTEGRQVANPALLERVQRGLLAVAEGGDFTALIQFSTPFSAHAQSMGITETQRQGFNEAVRQIQVEIMGAEAAKALLTSTAELEAKYRILEATPPLTPEQRAEAEALAARVVNAWRKRQGKGG
jgi:hypothetical protein